MPRLLNSALGVATPVRLGTAREPWHAESIHPLSCARPLARVGGLSRRMECLRGLIMRCVRGRRVRFSFDVRQQFPDLRENRGRKQPHRLLAAAEPCDSSWWSRVAVWFRPVIESTCNSIDYSITVPAHHRVCVFVKRIREVSVI